MEKKEKIQKGRYQVILALSSLPIILIFLGMLIELLKFVVYRLHPVNNGVVDVTIEHLVFTGGLYLALPCGVIVLITSIIAKSKGIIPIKIYTTCIILSILGILFGILIMIYYAMVSSFVF